MAILDRFLKRQTTETIRYEVSFDNPVVMNYDANQLYRTQPNLRAVISFLAESVAQLPLKTYERVSDTDRERLNDSKTAELLRNPNPYMTTFEIVEQAISDLLLFGEFVWLVSPADSVSGWSVTPIPPTWIVEEKGGNAYGAESFLVKTKQGLIEIPTNVLFTCHNYNPGKPGKGSSPVSALKQTLMEQIEADTYRRQVWKNGGRMSAYITRPKDVEAWSVESAQRFKDDLRENWTSRGSRAGGMPVLEDGMEVKTVGFSAHEQEWATAKTLSREEVAGVYHVPPAVIWHTNGQTYASAKDNARALYTDTLAPLLKRVEQRATMFLLPMIGEQPGVYVEFDLSAKLRGSFEEQAQVLQSSVGAPWLTRNEARAMQNLPAIEGGDELVTPLNVLTGGLASPRDTASGEPFEKIVGEVDFPELDAMLEGLMKDCEPEVKDVPRVLVKGESQDVFDKYVDLLRKFTDRQARAVLSAMGAGGEWWDGERWDKELSDDLEALSLKESEDRAHEVLSAANVPLATYSVDQTRKYIRVMCENRAENINRRTLELLEEAEESAEDGARQRVFDAAYERAERAGACFACSVLGFAMYEALNQAQQRGYNRNVWKTWRVNSDNPRPSHAALDGERVPWDEPFSNGADYPGDTTALDAEEVANCRCTIDMEMN